MIVERSFFKTVERAVPKGGKRGGGSQKVEVWYSMIIFRRWSIAGKAGVVIGVTVLSSVLGRMEAVPEGGKQGTVRDRGVGANNACPQRL